MAPAYLVGRIFTFYKEKPPNFLTKKTNKLYKNPGDAYLLG